jgi:hypothetical protein
MKNRYNVRIRMWFVSNRMMLDIYYLKKESVYDEINSP